MSPNFFKIGFLQKKRTLHRPYLFSFVYCFYKILRICLSASFTQDTDIVTQVQESISDFNPESKSGDF